MVFLFDTQHDVVAEPILFICMTNWSQSQVINSSRFRLTFPATPPSFATERVQRESRVSGLPPMVECQTETTTRGER